MYLLWLCMLALHEAWDPCMLQEHPLAPNYHLCTASFPPPPPTAPLLVAPPSPPPKDTHCVCCPVHEDGLVSNNPPAGALSKQTHLGGGGRAQHSTAQHSTAQQQTHQLSTQQRIGRAAQSTTSHTMQASSTAHMPWYVHMPCIASATAADSNQRVCTVCPVSLVPIAPPPTPSPCPPAAGHVPSGQLHSQ
jgi:hypothetical protein